jgi:hypothetical protein
VAQWKGRCSCILIAADSFQFAHTRDSRSGVYLIILAALKCFELCEHKKLYFT